jgi:formylglycine-generating enzyme required for sulfatase activity
VRSFFNANDTAYMVMDYYEGISLDGYFSQVKPVLEPEEAVPLVNMILDGLQYIHEREVLHRDLKPSNIYLAAVGRPILLDFGAARQAAGVKMRSISVVLTEGYAPLEQYQRRGIQGAWTDTYGLTATLYRMLLGKAPPIALDRLSGPDPLESHGFDHLSPALVHVLRKGLANRIEDRYQSAAELQQALTLAMQDGQPEAGHSPSVSVASSGVSVPTASVVVENSLLPDRHHPTTISPTVPKKSLPLLALAAGVAALTLGGLWWSRSSNDDNRPVVAAKAPAAVSSVAVAATTSPVSAVSASVAVINEPTSVPSNGIDLLLLPTMKSLPSTELVYEGNGSPGEEEARKVRLDGLSASETEVTVAQFRYFVEQTRYQNPAWGKGCAGATAGETWSSGSNEQPVVCVSWLDATAYARWLSQVTGQRYRLLSESEWIYAHRGNVQSRYWWGNDVDPKQAACQDCGGVAPTSTTPAKSGGVNPFGLYGTASNVREWTCSAFGMPNTASADHCIGSAPKAATIRGAAWSDTKEKLGLDARDSAPPELLSAVVGFRVLKES